MAKKLKDVVKKNPEPARGTNYVDPGQLGQYSAQNQVAEDGSLSQYLKAKGINPISLSKETKISHAKSNTFKKWRNDHKFEEVDLSEDALLDRYLSAHGINPQYAPKNTKIAHSKSKQYIVWKKQHMNEAKTIQGTTLDKFRQASAERAKKHDEIEKKQSKTGEGMTSAIDRLEKQLNKEEMVDEMDKSQKGSAGWNLDDYDYSKGKWSEGKPVKVKDAKKDFKSILDKAFRPNKKSVKEDNFGDPQAATQSCFDGANNTDDTHEILNRKRGLSKSARIIKSLYKHHKVTEEIYDHEKDDKDQTSPGRPKNSKNPSLSKQDPDDAPDGSPKARAVMSGGKTLTGEPRDTVEIDPQMKARPDLNGNKKDDGSVVSDKKAEKK